MARGWRSSRRFRLNFRTLGRQSSRVCSHEPMRLAEGREVEEEVLGLDEDRGLAVDAAARVLQVDRVELVAAVVALVAPRAVVGADGAGALDVAVRQGAPGGRRDGTEGRLRDDVAVAVQRLEELLHDGVVVAGRRAGEQVVGQPEPLQVLDDDPVVAVRELAGRHALAVGLHLDRRPVLVGAAHHQHVVADHPVVAAEHVGGDAEAGHVTDVPWAVGVRPGDSGEDGAGHALDPRCPAQPPFAPARRRRRPWRRGRSQPRPPQRPPCDVRPPRPGAVRAPLPRRRHRGRAGGAPWTTTVISPRTPASAQAARSPSAPRRTSS